MPNIYGQLNQKTMLVVEDLLTNGWKVKLDKDLILAQKGKRKWVVKAIWGKPNLEPIITKYICKKCGSEKLFKGVLCEDCWYKVEHIRLKRLKGKGF